jgi:GNAT superfamily N-acetyltransferase
MESIQIQPAVVSDIPFLAKCVVLAERAHTGKGIWDVLCPEYDVILKAFQHTLEHNPESHVHYSRFFVARDMETGEPVAAACGFPYPECGLGSTRPGLLAALKSAGYINTVEEGETIWTERFAFLDESFPANVDYNGTWMVEAVFTDPAYRGKGLALKIIQQVLAVGSKAGISRALISCAVGNNAALSVYQRMGFTLAGEGNSSDCLQKLGSSGFYILCKELSI